MRLIFTIIAIVLTESAWACACPELSLEAKFAKYENVFSVTVTEIKYTENETDAGGTQRAKFVIRNTYKGSGTEFNEIISYVNFFKFESGEIYSPSSCDSDGIVAGKTYVVFADSKEPLSYKTCGGNVELPDDYDVEDIVRLRKNNAT